MLFLSLLALPLFTQAAVASTGTPSEGPAQSQRPNVIVVLADDLGLGDLSATCEDSKITTPHLDGLAAKGMVFRDAHSPSAVCTPTRYGLLTGRYSWRSRLAKGVLNGSSRHLIPSERETVAHLMRRAGYATAMVGKWHLGWDWAREDGEIDFTKPVKNGPDANGFDEYFALAASLDMPPYVWVRTGSVTEPPDREAGVTAKEDRYGWYRKGPIAPDFQIKQVLPRVFAEARSFVERSAKGDSPFFLYLALPAPHTPIVPIEPFQGASELNPYADFVLQMDHHMGDLLNALEACGAAENTLVLFTSDNGCSPQANFELLAKSGHDPSAGFRGHKADLFEGGHRVPLIARWPGRIPAGSESDALISLTDLHATLGEIVGIETPDIEDSFSLLHVLRGADEGPRRTLINHSVSGHFALREGSWKLLVSRGSGGWSAPREPKAREAGLPDLQLYDLSQDPGETTNVAADHPDRVERMLKILMSDVARGRSTPGDPRPNDREITVRASD
ncbi:MAG: arylsulfatase [Planctomycetota bacterium]